ncbi:MAG: diguanylate cyclase [Chlorobiota bacterium]
MSNKLKELQSLLIPSDILPIGMILIGVIIAFFISEIAIKLIGVSISILGIVTLLMKLTTRMSSAVETKFKNTPSPNFKITVKKSPEAVRKVIENFEDTNTVERKKKPEESKNTMGSEEGFRIISKDKKNLSDSNDETDEIKNSSESNKDEKKPLDSTPKTKIEEKTEPTLPKYRTSNINFPTQNLFEELPLLKDHPDKEFEVFIKRILMAIRSVSNTKTACFFFYDEQTEGLILNSSASESKNILPNKTKIKSKNDVVLQIAKDIKPEILTDINPAAEIDLLPYYKSNSGTNSFIGIPVIYDKSVIGVLTADSKHTDAYDGIMVSFMGHFAKLISGLIRSYSDKYELAQNSKHYKLIEDLLANIRMNNEEELITSSLNILKNQLKLNELKIIISTNSIYKVYDSNKGLDKDTVNNKISSSTITEVINNQNDFFGKIKDVTLPKPLLSIANKDDFIFLAPISTEIHSYGALLISDADFIDMELRNSIITICRIIASKIENIRLSEIISNGLEKDPETGIYNKNKFEEEIEKESIRVSKFNISSSLVTIAIDEYESVDLDNPAINSIILQHINNLSLQFTSELDSIGLLDNQIYIILSGKDSGNSKLWAEQLRNKIASSQIEIEGRMINITISIGICSLSNNISIEELIKNSNKALSSSKVNSNSVSVY